MNRMRCGAAPSTSGRLASVILVICLITGAVVSLSASNATAADSGDWLSVPFPREYTTFESVKTAVMDVAEDQSGNAWALTADGVVFRLDKGGSRWKDVSQGLPAAEAEGGSGLDIVSLGDRVFVNINTVGVYVHEPGASTWKEAGTYSPWCEALTVFDGAVWVCGYAGVQRLDPATMEWESVNSGIPLFESGPEDARGGEQGAFGVTEDALYLGTAVHTENPLTPALLSMIGVYRLPRGASRWENTGLDVAPTDDEAQGIQGTIKRFGGIDWGVTRTLSSGRYVLCQVSGMIGVGLAAWNSSRFSVYDEAEGSWTELESPDDETGYRSVFSDMVWVHPADQQGTFVFPAPTAEPQAYTYDAAAGAWSGLAPMAIETWDAIGFPLGFGASGNATTIGGRLVMPVRSGSTAPAPPGFVASVPLPTEVSRDPAVIGTNLVLALIFALGFGFTSTLFNSTLRENHATLRRWVDPLLRPFSATAGKLRIGAPTGAAPRSRARRLLEPISIVVLAALIYSFLDPGFGFSARGLQLFLSLLVSVAVVTFLYEGVQTRMCRTRFHTPAALKLYPAALLVAVGCVVASRVVGFSPGYLYGFVGAMAFLSAAEPTIPCRGRMVLIASLGLMAVSVGTWFLAVPLTAAAASGGWLTQLLQGTAVAVFVAGLESVFFGLIPLSFMDGEILLRWRKPVWLALFAAVAFIFWHVLLNKNSQYAAAFGGQSTRIMLVLLGVFTTLTLASYFYFRSRRPRIAPLAARVGRRATEGVPHAPAHDGTDAGTPSR